MTLPYAMSHPWNGRCLGRPQSSSAAAAEAADKAAEAAAEAAAAPASKVEQLHAELKAALAEQDGAEAALAARLLYKESIIAKVAKAEATLATEEAEAVAKAVGEIKFAKKAKSGKSRSNTGKSRSRSRCRAR